MKELKCSPSVLSSVHYTSLISLGEGDVFKNLFPQRNPLTLANFSFFPLYLVANKSWRNRQLSVMKKRCWLLLSTWVAMDHNSIKYYFSAQQDSVFYSLFRLDQYVWYSFSFFPQKTKQNNKNLKKVEHKNFNSQPKRKYSIFNLINVLCD